MNFEYAEILLTLAEVSVAFAGFASLASLFGRSQRAEKTTVDAMRMMNMLTASLSATLFSLIPILFVSLQLQEKEIWRYSGAVAFVVWGLATYFIRGRAKRTRATEGFSRKASVINTLLSMTVSVLFLVCIAGFLANSFAAYFSALLGMLAVSGILFFRLIESLFNEPVKSREQ